MESKAYGVDQNTDMCPSLLVEHDLGAEFLMTYGAVSAQTGGGNRDFYSLPMQLFLWNYLKLGPRSSCSTALKCDQARGSMDCVASPCGGWGFQIDDWECPSQRRPTIVLTYGSTW